jgi:hypothetical protein
VRHKGGPSRSQNPKPSHQSSVLANKTWEHLFSDIGDPIVVEYTVFEVMGAGDWVWHEGEEAGWSQKAKN